MKELTFMLKLNFHFQTGQTQDPRQTADERIYGLGSGCPEEIGRSVPEPSQRRTQQDSGKTLEVKNTLISNDNSIL